MKERSRFWGTHVLKMSLRSKSERFYVNVVFCMHVKGEVQ